MWSQKRYEGVLQAFTEAGLKDCVKLVAIPTRDTTVTIGDPIIIRAVDKITGMNSRFPIRNSIAVTADYDGIIPKIHGLLSLREQFPLVWKYLKQLFGDPAITALVGAQDYTMVLAHEYLKQHGIAVPGEMSLIGFDNAELAIEDDLTSYHFLFSNIAADVLAYIINPTAPQFAGKRHIECNGTIIQRGTTGKAPP